MTDNKILWAMLCMTRQCWEQGIAAQALIENEEWELAGLLVDDMILRQGSDGRLCNIENTRAVTDSAFCIPAAYEVGKYIGSERILKACEKNKRFLLEEAPRAADGTLYHIKGASDIWADSAAFLPYALALLGEKEKGVKQMYGICKRLYRKEKGLYAHKWNEEKNEFARDCLWSTGNAWILTGLLRLYLEVHEDKLLDMFRELTDNMCGKLDINYFLHDIIDDEDSFADSGSSAMLAYAIYRGIKENMLDGSYGKTADRIAESVRGKINRRGQVLCACSSPTFDRPGTSVECQAHVLMMEAAAKR